MYFLDEDVFTERIDYLPLDFYWDNSDHFFKGCKGIVRDSKIINVEALAPTLYEFCMLLFNFTLENLDDIVRLKLRYPTEVYSLRLKIAQHDEMMVEALKSIKSLMRDYDTIIQMSFEDIARDSYYKAYIEPKRVNKTEKKAIDIGKIKSALEESFKEIDVEVDVKRVTSYLAEVYKKSGLYRIYNINEELIYIATTGNLGSVIPSMLKRYNGVFFDFALLQDKAVLDIYRIYYTALLKPHNSVVSKDCDVSNLGIKPLEFSEKVNILRAE